MAKTLITRTLAQLPNLRAKGDDATPARLVGYAAVFNQRTTIGDWWEEEIAPGAFASAIGDGADVMGLFNHSADHVLGRTKAGTLALREDDAGLHYEITLPDTTVAKDALENIRVGNITGSSIGFTVRKEEWVRPATPADLPLRRITEVEWLRDVGPVTFPAYEQTTAEAEARSRADALRTADPVAADLTLNAVVTEQLDADA